MGKQQRNVGVNLRPLTLTELEAIWSSKSQSVWGMLKGNTCLEGIFEYEKESLFSVEFVKVSLTTHWGWEKMYHRGNCGPAASRFHAQHPTEKSCALINNCNCVKWLHIGLSDPVLVLFPCFSPRPSSPCVTLFCDNYVHFKNHTPWFHYFTNHFLILHW